MKIHLFTVLFAVALSATASPTERWLDPECFAENRAPMRTSFIVFPTASEAVPENDYTRSPFYRTLNGEWAFLRAERPGAYVINGTNSSQYLDITYDRSDNSLNTQ